MVVIAWSRRERFFLSTGGSLALATLAVLLGLRRTWIAVTDREVVLSGNRLIRLSRLRVAAVHCNDRVVSLVGADDDELVSLWRFCWDDAGFVGLGSHLQVPVFGLRPPSL